MANKKRNSKLPLKNPPLLLNTSKTSVINVHTANDKEHKKLDTVDIIKIIDDVKEAINNKLKSRNRHSNKQKNKQIEIESFENCHLEWIIFIFNLIQKENKKQNNDMLYHELLRNLRFERNKYEFKVCLQKTIYFVLKY